MNCSDYIQIGILVAAFIGVWFAARQLSKMAESIEKASRSNDLAVLDMVLKIEDSINERKARVDEITYRIQANAGVLTTESAGLLQAQLNSAVESYLNAMDRLCACIIRGTIPEKDYKEDYVEALPALIETYNKHFKGIERRYKNILDLRERWRS